VVTETLVLPESDEEKPTGILLRTGWYDAVTGLRLMPVGSRADSDGFITLDDR
jgi:hypothetical protein